MRFDLPTVLATVVSFGLGVVLAPARAASAGARDLGRIVGSLEFPNPLDLLADCDTGFRPELDGFDHKNYGSYDDEGNCQGMSIAASWYFAQRRSPRLAERFRCDEVRAQEVARHLQGHGIGGPDALLTFAECVGPFGYQVGLSLIATLRVTRAPQLLVLRFASGPVPGHMVVAYGFERGHFLLYDPQYPHETCLYDFGLEGFARYRRASGGPLDSWERNPISHVAAPGLRAFVNDGDVARELDQGDDAAAAGFVSIVLEREGDHLTGTLSGGVANPSWPPTLVEVKSGGVLVTTAPLVNGRFDVELDPSFEGEILAKGESRVLGGLAFAGGLHVRGIGHVLAPLPETLTRTPGLVGVLGE